MISKATFSVILHQGARVELKPVTGEDFAAASEWRDWQEANGGTVTLAIEAEKKRSQPHHRKFFATIDAAFNQWPDGDEFQPENADHLRQFLEVSAGHRKFQDFPITEENASQVADMMVMFAEAIDGKKVFPRFGNGVVRLYWADSVSWSKLGHKQFCDVVKPVFDIIENTIGVPVDQLTRENKQAA